MESKEQVIAAIARDLGLSKEELIEYIAVMVVDGNASEQEAIAHFQALASPFLASQTKERRRCLWEE